jgi:hypothetical protein
MTQIAKFNATQVAVFGKIETVENSNAVPEATDVIIMTGVTYDPNIPTSSEALVGDFLSRDSVVNITDTFGDFSGDSYVPVLGSLVGSEITGTKSLVPISPFLECCNLHAAETTTSDCIPSATISLKDEAINSLNNVKTAVTSVKTTIDGTVVLGNALAAVTTDATDLSTLNTKITALSTFKTGTLNPFITTINVDVAAINSAIDTLEQAGSTGLTTFKTSIASITSNETITGYATTVNNIKADVIALNLPTSPQKTQFLNSLRDVASKLTSIVSTYSSANTSLANFKTNVAGMSMSGTLGTLKFTNSIASKSSLTAQIRKSSLDITEQKIVTLTGVRGTVDLNIKIAERPKFKFNYHGNITSIINDDAFTTNINTQKTNIAPVTLSSNIINAAISPMSGETYTNNISFVSFSASNFDGFDLKRTQTGSGDFWYPQGIAHDVMITILEDTARGAYTGSTDTTLSDATSFRPEDNVGKEFNFTFEQGSGVGSKFKVFMNKLTLKGYKHTTQGNVASIDLTFEASGVSELTLL